MQIKTETQSINILLLRYSLNLQKKIETGEKLKKILEVCVKYFQLYHLNEKMC